MNKNTGETLRFVLHMREAIFGEVSSNEAIRDAVEGASFTANSQATIQNIVAELTQDNEKN